MAFYNLATLADRGFWVQRTVPSIPYIYPLHLSPTFIPYIYPLLVAIQSLV